MKTGKIQDAAANAASSSPFVNRGVVSSSEPNTSSIWIENPYSYSIHYGLSGKSFTVEPRHVRWHSAANSVGFTIEFDSKFEKGYQKKHYRVPAGSRTTFVEVENGLDLHWKTRQEDQFQLESQRTLE